MLICEPNRKKSQNLYERELKLLLINGIEYIKLGFKNKFFIQKIYIEKKI